jgi:hypothetical protein
MERSPMTPDHGDFAMKYAILIYETADGFDARTGEDQAAYRGAWQDYSEALKHAGHHAGGMGLEPPSTGTTIRLSDGERTVQDGPYADTKEQLGGFFLVEMPDLETALDWAARCPLKAGSVEVRPTLGSCQTTAAQAVEDRAVLAN